MPVLSPELCLLVSLIYSSFLDIIFSLQIRRQHPPNQVVVPKKVMELCRQKREGLWNSKMLRSHFSVQFGNIA